MSEFGCDVKLLAQLLNPKGNEDSDEDDKTKLNQNLGPADINRSSAYAKAKDEEVIVRKSEEDVFEYESNEESVADSGWKKTPKWDITYRQQVTASDVFLQIGGKTPATASCENMILKIHLPEESWQNVDLKVTKDRVQLNSSKFHLDIPLPHPVDPQKGNAKFDNKSEYLIVTMVMEREFDYINF